MSDTPVTTLADVFELPERVHQGDFVLRLSEGVEHAERTLRDYVVTPQLAQCFEAALALIGSALEAHTSKAAYLHGSFGSGKSHFMAVLTLLLQGDPQARSIPELAAAVAQANAWTANRRFLVVPYHLIGAASMESALLGHYAEHVRRLHPEAPTPGFYAADAVFADARRLRATMGDGAFFAALNQAVRDGADGDDDGWGALGGDWDADGFAAALAAAPGDEQRVRLVGDLIDAFFAALRAPGAAAGERFVDLDHGLAVMSRHAQTLGYDAVILFLDELILWLASHAADAAFVSREGQKIAKLVEAMHADRPIPIVSFIARQRDLRELVGEHLPGAEQLGFADVLDWWQARFELITLEDRNLPAIVERRVLRPKSDAARAALEQAFARTARVRDEVLNVLLTRDGDRAMFRQVYPFTPALVQTLIAVSSLLQRERTALKLMLQLLVEQAGRLRLGDVIPVGDLFDVIAHGDEPFTQAMRMRFDDATKLYRTRLRPLLERGVGADQPASAAVDPARAARFRSDDRLLKTLLLAALAEGVEALRALTPARLAALNHGTIRSPIPGQEGAIVLGKCRQWAAEVGELKISDDGANPVIALQIVGVDTDGILANAAALDNTGNRIRKVRQLLCEGFPQTDSGDLLWQRYELTWRGTRRTCEIAFRNMREMNLSDLRNAGGGSWQVVIDWPFDEPPHTPNDDQAKIQEFLARGEPSDTLVWLPSFLTAAAQRDLGRLVVLEQVLTGNRLGEYGAHLSSSDREQARVLLANQRDQMRNRVRAGLLAAYGISAADTAAIDQSHELERHFMSLNPQYDLRPPVAADFRTALDHVLGQALAAQYPDHPDFGAEVRRPALRRTLEVVERAVADPEERVEVPRNVREQVRGIAIPLGLGDMGETHFKLASRWIDELEQKRAQHGSGDSLTVGDLRTWIEAPERRGLPRDVQNLVILTFAAAGNWRFTLHGTPMEGAIDKLDDRCEMVAQPLPAEDDYQRAAQRAGEVFGVAASPLLNVRGVRETAQAVRAAAARQRAPVAALADALRRTLQARGMTADAGDRARTVDATLALIDTLDDEDDVALVAALAQAEVPTSTVAMGAVMKDAAALAGALAAHRQTAFAKLAALPAPFQERVTAIDQALNDALRRDEHVTPLVAAVQACERRALDLLGEAAAAAVPVAPPAGRRTPLTPPPGQTGPDALHGSRDVAAAEVAGVLAEIERALRTTGATRVAVEWRVYSDASDGSA